MLQYEYKVVVSPKKAKRVRGVNGKDGRFAHMVETKLNDVSLDGWEFQRSETLPAEIRTGWLRRKRATYQTILVFRRLREQAVLNEIDSNISLTPAKAPAKEPENAAPAKAPANAAPAKAPANAAPAKAPAKKQAPKAAATRVEPPLVSAGKGQTAETKTASKSDSGKTAPRA